MKVAIVAGGTGGHIYPAIAVAQELQGADINSGVLFLGTEDGLEKDIILKERFSLKLIRSKKIMRKFSLDLIKMPFIVLAGIMQSMKALKEFAPDVLFSTGGYVSFPACVAARLLRIPIIIHEQNTIPGATNRLCQVIAQKVAISYPASSKYFLKRKTVFTGNPVRSKILKAVQSVSRQKLNLDQKRKTLLVLGGSQGSHKINEAVAKMIDFFTSEDLQVIHITGNKDYQWVLSQTENRVLNIEEAVSVVKGRSKQITLRKYRLYHPMPYMYNIWDGLSAADLVVCRAGATAIAEICARGLPSIIIPFPFASEDHQKHNAAVLSQAGASVVIDESYLSAEGLKDSISALLKNNSMMSKMSKASKSLYISDSASRIVDLMYAACNKTREETKPSQKPKIRRARKS